MNNTSRPPQLQATKLLFRVAAAVQANGEDSPQARALVRECYRENLKKDRVERAVAKGKGEGDSGLLERLVYEAYGPGSGRFRASAASKERAQGAKGGGRQSFACTRTVGKGTQTNRDTARTRPSLRSFLPTRVEQWQCSSLATPTTVAGWHRRCGP